MRRAKECNNAEEVAADKESQYFSYMGKRQIRTLLFPYYLYYSDTYVKDLDMRCMRSKRQIRSTEATKEGRVEEKEKKRKRDGSQ